MKAKASKSSRNRVRSKPRQVEEERAKRFLRNSGVFARLYEHSQRKKGWLFAMQAKLVTFYVDNVEPKLKAAKARLTRFKLWITGRLTTAKARVTKAKRQGIAWVARHKHRLWVMAIVATARRSGLHLAAVTRLPGGSQDPGRGCSQRVDYPVGAVQRSGPDSGRRRKRSGPRSGRPGQ
jgi:hypothetical protein